MSQQPRTPGLPQRTGTSTTFTATRKTRPPPKGNARVPWLALGGCVLTVLGALGPWVTANLGSQGSLSVPGYQGLPGIAAILLAGLGISVLIRARDPTVRRWVPAGLMSVVLLLAILNVVAAQTNPQAQRALATGLVQLGWGLYLTIAGSLVAVVGGLMERGQTAKRA